MAAVLSHNLQCAGQPYFQLKISAQWASTLYAPQSAQPFSGAAAILCHTDNIHTPGHHHIYRQAF